MEANSRIVDSNQEGIHPDLEEVVLKLKKSKWKGPLHQPTLNAFKSIRKTLEKWKSEGTPWILDSGCGVGASSFQLANLYPQHQILGIDRSEVRLSKISSSNQDPLFHLKEPEFKDRIHFLRAELSDFWRLLLKHELLPNRHFLLYPNPYPKKAHLKKRFHGSISFQDILAICPNIELRSNWKIYLEEFQFAYEVYRSKSDQNFKSELKKIHISDKNYMTHFEKKYSLSSQDLFQLSIQSTN